MQMLILGFPTEQITLTVLSDIELANEMDRQVAKEQCWQPDFLNTVTRLTDTYNIDSFILCGPEDYTAGLAEQLKDRFDNKMILPIPMDKIENPPGADTLRESGLIL